MGYLLRSRTHCSSHSDPQTWTWCDPSSWSTVSDCANSADGRRDDDVFLFHQNRSTGQCDCGLLRSTFRRGGSCSDRTQRDIHLDRGGRGHAWLCWRRGCLAARRNLRRQYPLGHWCGSSFCILHARDGLSGTSGSAGMAKPTLVPKTRTTDSRTPNDTDALGAGHLRAAMVSLMARSSQKREERHKGDVGKHRKSQVPCPRQPGRSDARGGRNQQRCCRIGRG